MTWRKNKRFSQTRSHFANESLLKLLSVDDLLGQLVVDRSHQIIEAAVRVRFDGIAQLSYEITALLRVAPGF